ncbi:MAG: hypothetical protein WAT39_18115 [Planctomycetota bacterium]
MNKRKPLVVAAIVTLVGLQAAAGGTAWFLRHGAQCDVAAARLANTDLQRRLAEAPAAPAVETVPEPSRWRLLEGPDVAGTMQSLQGIGDATGVTFDGIKAAQSTTPGRQSFQLNLRGTPVQVCTFLAAVEQHERLLVIETGRVMPGGGEQLALEIGVATYHQAGGQ